MPSDDLHMLSSCETSHPHVASSLIANSLQVNFDSVLGIPDDEGMVMMFRALVSTDIRCFRGCPSVLYEQELEQFFDTASVKDHEIICAVRENLLVYLRNFLPVCLSYQQQGMVTKTSKQAKGFSSQICALLESAPNLTMGEAKTFPPLKILTGNTVGTYVAKQKGIDDSNEEDEPVVKKTALKKSVSKKRSASPSDETVIKKKRTTVGRAAPAEKEMAMVPIVQDVEPLSTVLAPTPKAQRRCAPKRKLVFPTGSDDEIVDTEPDVEPLVKKQREKTTADDVDNIIDEVISKTAQMETDVEEPSLTRSDDTVVEVTKCSTASNDEDDNLDGAENEIARKMTSITAPKQFLKEPLSLGRMTTCLGLRNQETEQDQGKEIEAVSTSVEGKTLDDEYMSIDDLLTTISDDAMLPSVTAAEITRIQFERSIEIRGVQEGDWYKASLPKIPADAKRKAPLQEIGTIKGHPAREIFILICADIEFIVQLRAKVIDEVAKFFNSFSLRRLAFLGSTKDIVAKEERVLTWAETDWVQIALQRREYITTKYRELLQRKFLEARLHNFVSGQPQTA
ncbi:splicing factor 3B subunit 1-like [Dorcoceras hygrometricum]|uniref:Splicing factor 3B subunit 1-like n=1 Tax=Dorcoceras hygrometricum TaxID=472368 RepID=A0A2Z7BQI1_9LAMI|nr:splicing factor 3B subunit 1-like [Dorcoceras hygrometricum]